MTLIFCMPQSHCCTRPIRLYDCASIFLTSLYAVFFHSSLLFNSSIRRHGYTPSNSILYPCTSNHSIISSYCSNRAFFFTDTGKQFGFRKKMRNTGRIFRHAIPIRNRLIMTPQLSTQISSCGQYIHIFRSKPKCNSFFYTPQIRQ